MEMRVNQSRHHDSALNIDDATCIVAVDNVTFRADGDDDAVIDGDCAILNESNTISGHRQKMATHDERVKHRLPHASYRWFRYMHRFMDSTTSTRRVRQT